MSINIAIDGPAGAGKSSIARRRLQNSDIFMLIPERCTEVSLFML